MKPSTGSRSAQARDHGGRFIKRGSLVERTGPVNGEQQEAGAAQVAAVSLVQPHMDEDRVQSDEENEVSDFGSDGNSLVSSSDASEFSNEEVGKSVLQQGMCSAQLQEDGRHVAQQVFVDMPHSIPVAAGVNLGADSSARGLEKEMGSGLMAPWVNLFKDNRKVDNGYKLEEVVVEGDLVQLDEEDVYPVEEAVGICLVGLFSGKFPGAGAVQRLWDGWKVGGKHWIHRSGWILFEFGSEEDRLKVLKGGPYFAYGSNLMLKILPRCFRFGSEVLTTVPAWIQLPDLPLDCWNERALSKIVSKVGTPIATDHLTRIIERISFARVLVEVDVSKELVTSVEVKLPTGVVYNQLVVFESAPIFCKKCKTFGHGDAGCNKVSGGRNYPLFVPKRKMQHGGVDKSNIEAGAGYKGGPCLSSA